MSKKNIQRLWLAIGAIVTGICIFAIVSSGWLTYIMAGPSSLGTMARKNSLLGLLFIFIGVCAIILRMHPRFAGINPLYQRQYDSFLVLLSFFAVGMASEGFLQGLPKTPRDVFVTIGILIPTLAYSVNYLLLPEFLKNKQYSWAHHILDMIQPLAPWSTNLYITRAYIYHQQYDFEKTIQAADHAIALLPLLKKSEKQGSFDSKDLRRMSVHQTRMLAYFSLAQHEIALEDAEVLVRIQPAEAIHLMNRSMALRKRGDFDAAEADLDAAAQMKLPPAHRAFLTYSRANLIAIQNRPIEALNLYRFAVKTPLSKDEQKTILPEIFSQIGLLEMQNDQDREAEQAFKAVEELNPEFIHLGFVLLHAKRGEWNEAVTLWQHLLSMRPTYAHVDILRRHYFCMPFVLDLIEQVIVRSESAMI